MPLAVERRAHLGQEERGTRQAIPSNALKVPMPTISLFQPELQTLSHASSHPSPSSPSPLPAYVRYARSLVPLLRRPSLLPLSLFLSFLSTLFFVRGEPTTVVFSAKERSVVGQPTRKPAQPAQAEPEENTRRTNLARQRSTSFSSQPTNRIPAATRGPHSFFRRLSTQTHILYLSTTT